MESNELPFISILLFAALHVIVLFGINFIGRKINIHSSKKKKYLRF
jgi:hypothetical protein